MNKYHAILLTALCFLFLFLWAKQVLSHLGASLDSFILYALPLVFVVPLVTAAIVYLSPNQ